MYCNCANEFFNILSGARGRSMKKNYQAKRMKPSYNSARKIDNRQFLKSESEKKDFKNGISSNMKSRKQGTSFSEGKSCHDGQSSCNGKHFKKTKPVHQKIDNQKLKEKKYEDKDVE